MTACCSQEQAAAHASCGGLPCDLGNRPRLGGGSVHGGGGGDGNGMSGDGDNGVSIDCGAIVAGKGPACR